MATVERLSSYLGRGVVLPYDARPDLASTNVASTGPIAPGFVSKTTVSGDHYEILETVTFTWVTSAVVANRFLGIIVHDVDNNVIFQVIMPGSQPASTSYRYTFMLDAGGSFTSGVFGIAPLPFILMQPGYSWQIFGSNLDPGDIQNGMVAATQLIPTGPPRSYDDAAQTLGASVPMLLT